MYTYLHIFVYIGNIGDESAAVGSKAIDPFLNAGSNMANRRQTSRGGLGLQKKWVINVYICISIHIHIYAYRYIHVYICKYLIGIYEYVIHIYIFVYG
jgi:hypothetical protein